MTPLSQFVWAGADDRHALCPKGGRAHPCGRDGEIAHGLLRHTRALSWRGETAGRAAMAMDGPASHRRVWPGPSPRSAPGHEAGPRSAAPRGRARAPDATPGEPRCLAPRRACSSQAPPPETPLTHADRSQTAPTVISRDTSPFGLLVLLFHRHTAASESRDDSIQSRSICEASFSGGLAWAVGLCAACSHHAATCCWSRSTNVSPTSAQRTPITDLFLPPLRRAPA